MAISWFTSWLSTARSCFRWLQVLVTALSSASALRVVILHGAPQQPVQQLRRGQLRLLLLLLGALREALEGADGGRHGENEAEGDGEAVLHGALAQVGQLRVCSCTALAGVHLLRDAEQLHQAVVQAAVLDGVGRGKDEAARKPVQLRRVLEGNVNKLIS